MVLEALFRFPDTRTPLHGINKSPETKQIIVDKK